MVDVQSAAPIPTGTSGHKLPYLDAANTWSAQQTIALGAALGIAQIFSSTEPSAAAGPDAGNFRLSPSPLANDLLGRYIWYGNDSALNITAYSHIDIVLVDPADGAEDGRMSFATMINGADGYRFHIGDGLYTTGAIDKGAGTVNAVTQYENGVALAAKYAPVLAGMPVGAVTAFAGAAAPSGWLLCYGQAVSRTTYALLYTAFGGASSPYGQGDGSTTFNLPDLRGRVIAGKDNMGGVSANLLTNPASTISGIDGDILGGIGGHESHQLTVAQMSSHAHPGSTITLTDNFVAANVSGNLNNRNSAGASAYTNVSVAATPNIASQGGDQRHNNVQPTMILNHIVFAGV